MKIAPSMLSCDFAKMRDELIRIDKGGADWIHLDVMDGHFVPNITIGPAIVSALRQYSKLPFDVHLMIDYPLDYIEQFAKAGADIITFHIEAKSDIQATIDKIKSLGVKPGLVIKPKTSAEEAKELGKDMLVEIDGGVNDKTISQAAKFGVDVCVSGTGVFKASDAKEAIDNLKRLSEV